MSLDSLTLLNIELASGKPHVTKTMTGNVIVWDIPQSFLKAIENGVKEAVQSENNFAKLFLSQNKIAHSGPVYQVVSNSKDIGDNKANIRFKVGYSGPKNLPAKLHGKIHVDKQKLISWLESKAVFCMNKAFTDLHPAKKDAVNPNGSIDISIDGLFVMVKAKITPYQAAILLQPKRGTYLPALDRFLPAEIEGIKLEKVKTAQRSILMFKVHGANRPFLDRFVRVADSIVETVVPKMSGT